MTLIIAVVLLAILTSLVLSSALEQNSAVDPPTRVAFVFAGSARTFVFPSVKKTIKRNLIQAFCPAPTCTHDVFVRVSSSDNNHVGISATGNLTTGTPEMRALIDESMQAITPTPEENGKLHRMFVDIGSAEEKHEMFEYGRDSLKHKIYRDLDPRRYSMYFNRWKAYELMLKNEQSMGRNYTWVVFARLDAGWGAPINPVSMWSPDRVYMPEIWHADVPDTFALLPRHLSTMYFSMEDLMKPKVLCLGGPNLDVATLEPSYLHKIGYSEHEIEAVRTEDCRVMHPHHDKITEGKSGLKWSTAGLSEFFLKRRLAQYGYVIQDGTIRLISVFMFILRYPLEPLCLYCKTDFLISWTKTTSRPNAGLYPSCFIVNVDWKKYASYQPGGLCKPTGELFPIERDEQAQVVSRDNCLLHEENTDLNFLQFRIRTRAKCLTSTRSEFSASLATSQCINYKRRRFLETYVEEQLFHTYPLIKGPQKIVQYTRFPNEQRLCLTASPPSKAEQISDEKANNLILGVSLQMCSKYGDLDFPSVQMFSVEKIENQRLNTHSVNIASTANWKPLTSIALRWTWQNPSTMTFLEYCLTSPPGNVTAIVLKKCDANIGSERSVSRAIQSFLLERTVVAGPPLRPGIMIGNQPAWSDQY